jgi:ABC-2 type transport system ATP-binding protein
MIVTESLTKHFDDFVAVEGVNLQVGSGEVLALLGPNGAGKTTTVRMLTSVLRPTSGHATVAGFDVIKDAPQVRASVGVLTENHGLYNRMPADEYLDFFGRLYGLSPENRKARSDYLLEHFGLAEAQKRKIGEYSKGMRQKLALARAMLHSPKVLLLDEPTSAMDPESSRLVRDAIHDLRSDERAIIICTHNLVEAEELADRIAIIRRGRIIAVGTAAALKKEYLGHPEFEAVLGQSWSRNGLQLPSGSELTGTGETWLRFYSEAGESANPDVLRRLLDAGLPVVRLNEVPQSLESVYLMAMNRAKEQEAA